MVKVPMAGYSGTPLAKKLGLKAGQRAALVGVPAALLPVLQAPDFAWCATVAEAGAVPTDAPPLDFVHLFAKDRATLEPALPALRERLAPAGMIWASWPKKASRVRSDLTEDVIRAVALSIDLVDVKVCAVDDTWSGLKLVIPVAKRPRAWKRTVTAASVRDMG